MGENSGFPHPQKELERLVQGRLHEKRRKIREKNRKYSETIRNRINVDIIEPFPAGAFWKLKCNGIWDMILNHLTNSVDETSAFHTCLTFYDYFEARQKELLLPEVLKILHENRYNPSSLSYRKEWCDILSLRAVSTSWRKLVDSQFFATTFSHPTWYLHMHHENWNASPIELHHFRREGDIDSVLNSGIRAEPEPDTSILRSVCISTKEMNTHCMNKAVTLFEKYGRSVWSLWFRGKQATSVTEDAYQAFVNLTWHMPHLKALILSNVTSQEFWYYGQYEINLPEIPLQLHLHPFPVFEELEHLECQLEENEYMLQEIFTKSPGLKSVLMSRNQRITLGMSAALQNLHLQRFETWNVDLHGEVLNLRRVSWPLKVLSLWSPTGLTFSRIVPVINHFHGTLETLKIVDCFIEKDVVDDKVKLHLDLPHLKNLHMHEINEMSISMNELLPLKSLEKLVIGEFKEDEFSMHSLRIEMMKLLENFNIWTCFPYLKQVVFLKNGMTYVRHGTTIIKNSKHVGNILSVPSYRT